MKFLTRLCQDDVTTSRGDVISKKEVTYSCAGENLGEITKGNLEICYGSGVMQQKVGLGANSPTP